MRPQRTNGPEGPFASSIGGELRASIARARRAAAPTGGGMDGWLLRTASSQNFSHQDERPRTGRSFVLCWEPLRLKISEPDTASHAETLTHVHCRLRAPA